MHELKKAKSVVVFDVEAVGLHGIGFAFGAVHVELATGRTLDEWLAWCEPEREWGTAEGFAFVEKHCMPSLRSNKHDVARVCAHPAEVRHVFWKIGEARDRETTLLAADTAWPVEARFLAACVDDAWAHSEKPITTRMRFDQLTARSDAENPRYWTGPYPLIDIATVLAIEPVEMPRVERELPAHDPLCDARHSARQLIVALRHLASEG